MDNNSKKTWNFLMLDNRIFNFCEKKLINSTDFLLFVFLTKFLDPSKSKSIVFPGNKIIENEIGLKKSTVQNSLKNLERVGLIKRVTNKNNHKRKIQINLRIVANKDGKFRPLKFKAAATSNETVINLRRREKQEKRRKEEDLILENLEKQKRLNHERFMKQQRIEYDRQVEDDAMFW